MSSELLRYGGGVRSILLLPLMARCVCVGDVVFSVCIVRRGALGARVWEVGVFCHADVVCLCLMCIL